jgi:hypothetical protein
LRDIVVVAVAHLKGTPCYQFWLDTSKEQELKRRFLEAASGVLLSPTSSDTDVMVRSKRPSSVFPYRIVVGWLVGWLVGWFGEIHTFGHARSKLHPPDSFIHSIIRRFLFSF